MIKREMLFFGVRLMVFVWVGLASVQAGKDKASAAELPSLDTKKAFVVYASNWVYDRGNVLPGVNRLFQERGYAAVAPGGSPILRLTIQHYQAPERTRYAYLDTLNGMEGPMVATRELETYHLGAHTFRWIVAPVEDADELDNFGFRRDQIITYDPSRGETIEWVIRQFIVNQRGFRPTMRQSWDNFLENLPNLLQGYLPLNYDNERVQGIQVFERALEAIYEPIVTALAGRRSVGVLTLQGEAITREKFEQALKLVSEFQAFLQMFAQGVEARLWLGIWNRQIQYWRNWVDLYYSYIRLYEREVARGAFVNTIADLAVTLIEGAGRSQEIGVLADLQDVIFVRTNPSAGAMGWGTLMDRPFHADDPYLEEEIDIFTPEPSLNLTQTAPYGAGQQDSARLVLYGGIGGGGCM